jgi:hypothetical protein
MQNMGMNNVFPSFSFAMFGPDRRTRAVRTISVHQRLAMCLACFKNEVRPADDEWIEIPDPLQ